jgi:hypothetical protein
MPGRNQFLATLGVKLLWFASVVVYRSKEAQGTVQAILVVPSDQTG